MSDPMWQHKKTEIPTILRWGAAPFFRNPFQTKKGTVPLSKHAQRRGRVLNQLGARVAGSDQVCVVNRPVCCTRSCACQSQPAERKQNRVFILTCENSFGYVGVYSDGNSIPVEKQNYDVSQTVIEPIRIYTGLDRDTFYLRYSRALCGSSMRIGQCSNAVVVFALTMQCDKKNSRGIHVRRVVLSRLHGATSDSP